VNNLHLRRGDIVRIETSGGGGLGDPRRRTQAEIEHDLRLGYVSPGAARRDYGLPAAAE